VGGGIKLCVCVCVCVWLRDTREGGRERGRGVKREKVGGRGRHSQRQESGKRISSGQLGSCKLVCP
jgi:hypothetical protein